MSSEFIVFSELNKSKSLINYGDRKFYHNFYL